MRGKLKGLSRLNPEQLIIPGVYQRHGDGNTPDPNISKRRIEKMLKEGWDDFKARVITVSLRKDGKYYVVDGAHRVRLAILAGIKIVPANVYVDLDVKDEAELYETQNLEKHPNPADFFKSRLFREDPDAVWLAALISKHGMVWRGADDGVRPVFKAVGTVYSRMGLGGNARERIEKAFSLISDTWGFDAISRQGSFFSAVLTVTGLIDSGAVNRKNFVERLSRVSTKVLRATASSNRLIYRSADTAYLKAFEEFFNKKSHNKTAFTSR